MPRQLVTIGDLASATPLRRTRVRRQRMMGMIQSADATTGGEALQGAALDLLNHFDSAGVTPESTQDALVGAFQLAWNQDPANASDQLVPDSKYGPLTKGALDAMTGGIAPAVNGGPAPAPSPAPPSPVKPSPAVGPAAPASEGSELAIWLLVAAALVGGYLLLRKKKRGGGGSRRRSSPLVEVRSNPRRRRRNAELIP
jgi:hypothetical protein